MSLEALVAQRAPASWPGGEESAVAAAIAGSYAVVNAVSLYVERGKDTFRSVQSKRPREWLGLRRKRACRG